MIDQSMKVELAEFETVVEKGTHCDTLWCEQQYGITSRAVVYKVPLHGEALGARQALSVLHQRLQIDYNSLCLGCGPLTAVTAPDQE